MLTSDPAGTFVAYESPERTLQVFKSDGTADGPRITTGFRTSHATVALSPERGLLWAANFERGTLRCFHWRTGELRWERPDGYKKLASLDCSKDLLLVLQYGRGTVGPLTSLDQETGAEIATLPAVNSSFAQSDNRWIVATRRQQIEFRQDLAGPPAWSFETGTLEFTAAFDRDLALISHSGGMVKCFDLARGAEKWRFDCGEGQGLTLPALPLGTGLAFGLRLHRDIGGRGVPLFLDTSSGRVVREEPELPHPIQAIIDRGRAGISKGGLIRLPSLEWVPHREPIL